MLKIKDNVDLKELEKFGFNLITSNREEEINKTYYFKKVYCNDENDGRIFYTIKQYTDEEWTGRAIYIDSCGDGRLDETLYDLIKADLVEKVGDKE